MYPRYHDDEVKILLQIDQNKNIPHLLQNGFQDVDERPLILKPGFEYLIEISANGQASTKEFKELSLDKRQCKLSNEVEPSSNVKSYTKSNCRYECHIKEAFKHCGCVPWDFLHFLNNSTECDVFGRTCFLNAMENNQRVKKVHCPHCVEDCNIMTFKKSIKSTKSLDLKQKLVHYCNGYFCTAKG